MNYHQAKANLSLSALSVDTKIFTQKGMRNAFLTILIFLEKVSSTILLK
jgi:hypothetical protein